VATRTLIERCGGLPLALRIAAARLAARPHWTVDDLLRRLDDEQRRLDEFAHGGLSVRSSIAITYEALPDPARRLFRLLGLPTWSTFPHWVAAPLLDLDTAAAAELLEVLVEARAVEVIPSGASGGRRYRLHDLLRVYARERLAAEEPPEQRLAALRRLLGCQLHLTERAHQLEYGPVRVRRLSTVDTSVPSVSSRLRCSRCRTTRGRVGPRRQDGDSRLSAVISTPRQGLPLSGRVRPWRNRCCRRKAYMAGYSCQWWRTRVEDVTWTVSATK
jgi:hypothetical protein